MSAIYDAIGGRAENKTAAIEVAEKLVSQNYFGEFYATALAYRAAHIAAMAGMDAEGSASSRKDADVSISYNTGNGAGLESTHFGREYLELEKRCRTGGFVSTWNL